MSNGGAGWTEIIAVGVLSGVISPIVIELFRENFISRRRRQEEEVYRTYEFAVKALAHFLADALDFDLQAANTPFRGHLPKVKFRTETQAIVVEAIAMVRANMTEETAELLDRAFKADVSVESAPFMEFTERRDAAIAAMRAELNLKR